MPSLAELGKVMGENGGFSRRIGQSHGRKLEDSPAIEKENSGRVKGVEGETRSKGVKELKGVKG